MESLIKTNFSLFLHYKMNFSEIDNMIPWERDIYVEMIKQYVKEQEQKQRETQHASRPIYR